MGVLHSISCEHSTLEPFRQTRFVQSAQPCLHVHARCSRARGARDLLASHVDWPTVRNTCVSPYAASPACLPCRFLIRQPPSSVRRARIRNCPRRPFSPAIQYSNGRRGAGNVAAAGGAVAGSRSMAVAIPVHGRDSREVAASGDVEVIPVRWRRGALSRSTASGCRRMEAPASI